MGKKFPVRQTRIHDKGDCMENSKYWGCLRRALHDYCGLYVDRNDDGRYKDGKDIPLPDTGICQKTQKPLFEINPPKEPAPPKNDFFKKPLPKKNNPFRGREYFNI